VVDRRSDTLNGGAVFPEPIEMTEESNHSEIVVTIQNRYGLHARPAAEFVKLASRFVSTVMVEKDGLEVNGKSIMGVMMLAAECGSTLRIRAIGHDSEQAVQELARLVTRQFGESESDYEIDDAVEGT
jgi:phosphocarrier protein